MKIIGITMGDVAGVGAEVIVGAWSRIVGAGDSGGFIPVVFGHPDILCRAVGLLGLSLEVVEVGLCDLEEVVRAGQIRGRIFCVRSMCDGVLGVLPATQDVRAGEGAYSAIIAAIDAAVCGRIAAVVTAPIHKGSLNLAGYSYPGHTEIFAERSGSDDFAMMLYLPAGENIRSASGLAVVHVTLHTAMRNIFDQITIESVLAKIKLADGFMTRIAQRKPVIGVCSLNPHAGEGGLFGGEELGVICPAIDAACKLGLNVKSVAPADTIMIDAKEGKYDAVVAMFHDQGHIALKLLGMHRAVNITLGIPIIRTSVAHGTAFDKAWKGIADSGSMVEAYKVAVKLAQTTK